MALRATVLFELFKIELLSLQQLEKVNYKLYRGFKSIRTPFLFKCIYGIQAPILSKNAGNLRKYEGFGGYIFFVYLL